MRKSRLSLRESVAAAVDPAPREGERSLRLHRNLVLARERALTARQRQVLELYYDRGMSVRQIASQLGLAPSSVSRTMARARRRLYEKLEYSL